MTEATNNWRDYIDSTPVTMNDAVTRDSAGRTVYMAVEGEIFPIRKMVTPFPEERKATIEHVGVEYVTKKNTHEYCGVVRRNGQYVRAMSTVPVTFHFPTPVATK